MLDELQHSFDVIGLSQIKFKIDKDQLVNTSLLNYKFVSQPSRYEAGGVGFYIHNKLRFRVRSDLRLITDDFESMWIEIDIKNNRNMLCGIFYRHPNSNLESFTYSLYANIEKVHRESKYCIVIGDFNINLLNNDTHPPTEEFLNNLGSYFFSLIF